MGMNDGHHVVGHLARKAGLSKSSLERPRVGKERPVGEPPKKCRGLDIEPAIPASRHQGSEKLLHTGGLKKVLIDGGQRAQTERKGEQRNPHASQSTRNGLGVLTGGSFLTQEFLSFDRRSLQSGQMRRRLGRYTLDTDRRLFLRGRESISLSPKAFTLLTALFQKSPGALSKDEIHRLLWPDTFVEEGSLHNLISEIRRALGAADRRLVRTVPRFGYALTLEAQSEPTELSRFCVVVGEDVHPLRLGDNILGRSPEVDVPVEQTSVSRRHARLTASDTMARIEDLGSKNGTFVGRNRITGATIVEDGDQIFLGRALLVFRIDRRRQTTESVEAARS